MKRTILCSLATLIVLLIVSCSKESVLEPNVSVTTSLQKSDLHAVDGIAIFKSLKHFDEFTKSYNYSDANVRKSLESKFKFTSLMSDLEAIQENSEDERKSYAAKNKLVTFEAGQLNHVLFSDNIASVVNAKGHVIIGSTLFQFGKQKVSMISLLKSNGLAKAMSALQGDKDLQGLVKTSDITIQSKQVKSPNARYDLGAGGTYVQNNYVGSPWYLPCTFCRTYQYAFTAGVEIASVHLWTETCDEYLPYDEDCRCYSCAHAPNVEEGYYAYVKTYGYLRKNYRNGEYDSVNANYIRLKSTNANVYADNVLIPTRYDVRQSNVQNKHLDVWTRAQNASGSTTQLQVEGTFEFESQFPDNSTYTVSIVM